MDIYYWFVAYIVMGLFIYLYTCVRNIIDENENFEGINIKFYEYVALFFIVVPFWAILFFWYCWLTYKNRIDPNGE